MALLAGGVLEASKVFLTAGRNQGGIDNNLVCFASKYPEVPQRRVRFSQSLDDQGCETSSMPGSGHIRNSFECRHKRDTAALTLSAHYRTLCTAAKRLLVSTRTSAPVMMEAATNSLRRARFKFCRPAMLLFGKVVAVPQ